MSATPLEWIRLELIPLPAAEGISAKLLWWNPEQRILQGEGKDEVIALATASLDKGYLQTGTGTHIEITDPLHQPSQLAAVLAQYYWVIPQPVNEPGDCQGLENPGLLN